VHDHSRRPCSTKASAGGVLLQGYLAHTGVEGEERLLQTVWGEPGVWGTGSHDVGLIQITKTPKTVCPLSRASRLPTERDSDRDREVRLQGYLAHKKTPSPRDPAAGLSLKWRASTGDFIAVSIQFEYDPDDLAIKITTQLVHKVIVKPMCCE